MSRSEIRIDLAAVRANARTLREAAGDAELWAVVKANGYGHGAVDCARAALDGGASALCVATLAEALEVRAALPDVRLLVLGPVSDVAAARAARVELVVSASIPEDIPVHVKLDTGMGRWGVGELATPARNVVGLMTHLATADTDPTFARTQLERFREATEQYANLTRHAANSAATLRIPSSRFDAVRCGIALYGISPFTTDPAEDGLVPALSWRSEVADCKVLHAGESTGYGRRFVAERDTWIAIVPVGYGDGFRRDLSGTEVMVAGERRRVVGTVSMDAFAVELGAAADLGTPVTLIGDGIGIEEHARHAGTIGYELACGIVSAPTRADRVAA
ncbi:MAG TPA: alanine racemase [Gaiellaceae bacterium]|nr:alanine racemase [Gaiellaceae bacterium]